LTQLLSAQVIRGKTAQTLAHLLHQFDVWRAAAKEKTLSDLADLMLEQSGYRAMWQADNSPEAPGRIENLRELVRALGEFPNLESFLDHVGLVTDGAAQAAEDMVCIMTLHAAKGLEFDVVFLTGWEEGLFPSQRTLDEMGARGLEEERRLAYVGITRARKHLTISHAANRRIYNQWQSCVPSRFLAELPEDVIEFLDGGPYARRATGPQLFQKEMETILAGRVEPQPARAEPASIRKGARVKHEQFGYGVVLSAEGDHLQIAFKHGGVKKMLADYVELA
jgi:DNA helicase-2/ATP-dependent DNA helicase PcrA